MISIISSFVRTRTQFAVGLARMSRTIRERMNVRDNEVFTPIDLINAKRTGHTSQTNGKLIRKLFTYCTYTTIAQVVNIIHSGAL